MIFDVYTTGPVKIPIQANVNGALELYVPYFDSSNTWILHTPTTTFTATYISTPPLGYTIGYKFTIPQNTYTTVQSFRYYIESVDTNNVHAILFDGDIAFFDIFNNTDPTNISSQILVLEQTITNLNKAIQDLSDGLKEECEIDGQRYKKYDLDKIKRLRNAMKRELAQLKGTVTRAVQYIF